MVLGEIGVVCFILAAGFSEERYELATLFLLLFALFIAASLAVDPRKYR